jgi:hypothetical protein
MTADFFVVPTATYRLLFAFVILAHQRRRIVHIAVTAHPTAAWTAQQLREAFPEDAAPRYLIRDRDDAFAGLEPTASGMGIQEILTAPRSHGKTRTQTVNDPSRIRRKNECWFSSIETGCVGQRPLPS